jgi:tetratricopeptide (TPR) repeat protein
MAKKNKKLKQSPGHRKKTKRSGRQGVSSQQNMFQQALSFQQAGRLPEAEAIYRQILSVEPNHPEVLHFLGILAHQAGKSEIGIGLIGRALTLKPDYVEATYNLGIILHGIGRLEEALDSFRRSLALRPNYAEAYNNLGVILKDLGKLEEAIASFRQALTLKPNYAEAHNNLGNAFQAQGRLDDAVASYRRALNLQPDYAEAHNNLGITLADQDRLNEAVACFRQALVLNPRFAEACCNLGDTLKDQGKLDEAVATYRQELTLRPDHAETHNNLGSVLKEQGKLEEANASFHQALALNPDYAEAFSNLGNVLKNQGKLDEAVASYRRALTLKPDFAEAHHNLGVMFSELGKKDDAIVCCRKALSLKPDHIQAFNRLSATMKYTEVDDIVRAMEDLYQTKEDLPNTDRIDLGFALGKVYEDIGDYDKTFDFISKANELKRRSFEYSIQKERDIFARIKQTFSPSFFSSHRGSGNQDRTPIFIVGMPRSGTTLVEQVLASHPLIFGAGELLILPKLIDDLCAQAKTAQFPECIEDLGEDELERVGAEYIEKIRGHSDKSEYITDKLPHNFLHVGLIKVILPNAKVVHCVRNPMDSCFSIFKQDFIGPHEYSYDLVELGQYYNLYQDLMAHWERVLAGFMYTFRYEDMVADQQKETKNLLDFCGLPWDEACLTFHKTERRVATASHAQVRQPIYRDSVGLWKRYEKHLEPLRKAIYGREP